MAATGELAVVLGDRVLIPGGDLIRIGVADGAAPAFIELAAQLQFERVHTADELLVHLLDQGGIPGETAGIQLAHLIDQGLQLLPRLGTILHRGTHLIEKVQSLFNLALGVGRVRTLLWRRGLTRDARIAGVIVAHHAASAIATAVACRTGEAVAHRTRLASAGLTCLLAALLTALTGLAALTGLPVAAELSGLRLLAATAGLALSGLSVGAATAAGDRAAQTGEIVHGPADRGVLGSVLRSAHGASRVAGLAAQLLQVVGEGRFHRIGKLAATQPIRAPLHAVAEIVLIHAVERGPQLAGSRRLRGREFARRGAHLLGEVRQVIAHLLAIVDHLVDFLGGRVGLRLAGGASGVLPGYQVAHAIRLLLLLCRQSIGRLGHGVETAGGILLLQTAQQVGGFAQAVGGAPGVGRAGLLGGGALHVVVGLAQAVERLLGCLLAAVGAGIALAGGGTARLPAALARLSAGLPGCGTALLPLLALRTLLSLLTVLSELLFHLPLELLRFALQHFLLPFFFGGPDAIALLLGQVILALGQFVELFQSVFDFLRLLFGGTSGGLPGLVLIFLGIELEIEEGSQIARRTAPAAAPPPRPPSAT